MVTWTIYDHPADYPHGYVARKFLIGQGRREPLPTNDVLVSDKLDTLRARFGRAGSIPALAIERAKACRQARALVAGSQPAFDAGHSHTAT
jgi:hypothetical protein